MMKRFGLERKVERRVITLGMHAAGLRNSRFLPSLSTLLAVYFHRLSSELQCLQNPGPDKITNPALLNRPLCNDASQDYGAAPARSNLAGLASR
jgi:hypothetical protein